MFISALLDSLAVQCTVSPMARPTDPAQLAAFAETLVALRNRSGYPQHKVAEYLGVTPGLLSQWESGKGSHCHRSDTG